MDSLIITFITFITIFPLMCLFFFFDFFSSYLLFQINLWVIFIIFIYFFLYTLFPITFTVEYCFQQTKARIFSFGWYFMVKSWFYFNIIAFNFVFRYCPSLMCCLTIFFPVSYCIPNRFIFFH